MPFSPFAELSEPGAVPLRQAQGPVHGGRRAGRQAGSA